MSAMKASALLAAILVLVVTATMADSEPLKEISASNLNFTSSIYQILAKQEGNVFFSPLSIQVILALTYLGARGSTAQQMAAGLHLPADENVVKEGFKAMLTSLKSDENVTLSVANKVVGEQTFTLKPEFLETARNSFLADVDSVDFKHEAEAARLLINKWVEDKTNDKIKDLVQPGVVDDQTALILVNAVYFKGNWADKFDVKQTRKVNFYVSANETREVDMMHNRQDFMFATRDDLDCKVLQLPYAGDKLSMVIFLPNAVDGLAQLEAKLAEVDLPKLVSELYMPEVDVWLPKFKMEQTIDLEPTLRELGMVDMFDTAANFSGISDDGPLAVSGVVHKSFIDVNEEGTEAAAATGVYFVALSYTEPSYFKADHPFVFHIRDNHSGAVLFVGRLSTV